MSNKYPFALNCAMPEYLARPEVGSSALRTLIDQSPAHYLYQREHGSISTPAQDLGTLIHTAILEPALFKEKMIVRPEFSGKGSIALKDQWYLENEGRLILKPHEKEMIEAIQRSISANETARSLLSDGKAEGSIFWEDPETKLHLKARPDFFKDNHIVVDIKTCGKASYGSFKKDLANYNYHLQAAHYLEGASQVYGKEFNQFVIIAIEKEAPYGIGCYLVEKSAVDEGLALQKQALSLLKKCTDFKKFPGYPDEIVSMDLPTWAYKIEEQ